MRRDEQFQSLRYTSYTVVLPSRAFLFLFFSARDVAFLELRTIDSTVIEPHIASFCILGCSVGSARVSTVWAAADSVGVHDGCTVCV